MNQVYKKMLKVTIGLVPIFLLSLLVGIVQWVATTPTDVRPTELLPLLAVMISGLLAFYLIRPVVRRLLRMLQMVSSEDTDGSNDLTHPGHFHANRLKRFIVAGLAVGAFLLMSTSLSAQSLLIDVTVSNTAPGASDVFTYKIRYRCASITQHCFNSHITFTMPAAYDIVSTPGTGGNVASVTMTGNAVDIYLVSPPSAGAPPGALAAGASGILETKVKFKCGVNGTPPMPAAGTTVNFTVLPTFTVSTGSQVAVAPPAVTVPTVSACAPIVPPPPATNIAKANSSSTPSGLIQTGGSSFYSFSIPALAAGENFFIEDDVPDGILPTNIALANNVDVYVGGVWYSLASFGPSSYVWAAWINSVAEGAQLSATRISDGMLVPIPGCFRAGLSATTLDRVRINLSGPRAAEVIYMEYTVDPNATPGTRINCLTTNNPAWTTVCAQPIYIAEKPVVSAVLYSESYFFLGTSSLTSAISGQNWYMQSGNPNLYKDPNDGIAFATLSCIDLMGGGLVYETLLPVGFEYSTDPTRPNFWWELKNNLTTCSGPTFTAIPNYSGTQTLLRWEYPACSGEINVRLNFSFRYKGTTVLPDPLCFPAGTVSLYNGGQMASGGPPVCVTSSPVAQRCLSKPTTGGDVNSIKWVKGALDASFSRFPLTGNTNLAGDGVYEIFISSADWQNVKQLDVADILPYIGDQGMLSAGARLCLERRTGGCHYGRTI